MHLMQYMIYVSLQVIEFLYQRHEKRLIKRNKRFIFDYIPLKAPRTSSREPKITSVSLIIAGFFFLAWSRKRI